MALRQIGMMGFDRLIEPFRKLALAREQQVGEQQSHLPPAQAVGQLDAVDLDGQSSAQLNAGAFTSSRGH